MNINVLSTALTSFKILCVYVCWCVNMAHTDGSQGSVLVISDWCSGCQPSPLLSSPEALCPCFSSVRAPSSSLSTPEVFRSLPQHSACARTLINQRQAQTPSATTRLVFSALAPSNAHTSHCSSTDSHGQEKRAKSPTWKGWDRKTSKDEASLSFRLSSSSFSSSSLQCSLYLSLFSFGTKK